MSLPELPYGFYLAMRADRRPELWEWCDGGDEPDAWVDMNGQDFGDDAAPPLGEGYTLLPLTAIAQAREALIDARNCLGCFDRFDFDAPKAKIKAALQALGGAP